MLTGPKIELVDRITLMKNRVSSRGQLAHLGVVTGPKKLYVLP